MPTYKKVADKKDAEAPKKQREAGLLTLKSVYQAKVMDLMGVRFIWCVITGFVGVLAATFVVTVMGGVFVLGIWAGVEYFNLPDWLYIGPFALWLFLGFFVICFVAAGIAYSCTTEESTTGKKRNHFVAATVSALSSGVSTALFCVALHKVFQWTILGNMETATPIQAIIKALFGSGTTAKIFLGSGVAFAMVIAAIQASRN